MVGGKSQAWLVGGVCVTNARKQTYTLTCPHRQGTGLTIGLYKGHDLLRIENKFELEVKASESRNQKTVGQSLVVLD